MVDALGRFRTAKKSAAPSTSATAVLPSANADGSEACEGAKDASSSSSLMSLDEVNQSQEKSTANQPSRIADY